MGKRPAALLIVLFVMLSAGMMLFWKHEKLHAITGDEPHYLVIADGLLPTFELEQTGPYSREFRNRTIVESGLAPRDAVPSPSNTHAEKGPHGLFNVHNLGLPIVLAVPYFIGGETGARLTMIMMGAFIVFLLTRVVSLTGLSERDGTLVLLPIALGLPFVSGATQIYPDLPGGAICLAAVYLLLRGPRPEKRRDGMLTAILLAYLPWLHIRFALPMVVLLSAVVVMWRGARGLMKTAVRFGSPALASVVLLASYNWYAFGHAAGPYQSGDVMLNRIAIMQFLGLLFDQNQGIALQQPLHFVGIYYVVRIMRRHPLPVIGAVTAALAMIAPNSTHWNLYGGWSFSGRFGWGAATILTAVTVLGVATLLSEHRRTGLVVVVLAGLVQMRHLVAIFIQKRVLFPHTFDGWIGTYSTFWGPVEKYLPQWRDFRWAFSYVPNMLFVLLSAVLLTVGASTAISEKGKKIAIWSMTAPAMLTLFLFGRFGDLPYPQQRWAASVLPGLTGTVDNLSRVAISGDKKDLLTYGPFWEVPQGDYEVGIRYSTSTTTSRNGLLDVYFSGRNQVATTAELNPTDDNPRELFLPLHVSSRQAGKVEIRTLYEGFGTLRVDWIQLRRVSQNSAE